MTWLDIELDQIRQRQAARDAARQDKQAEMLTDADVADDFTPGLDDQPQDAP